MNKNVEKTDWEIIASKFSDIISEYKRVSGLIFENEMESFLTTVIDAGLGDFASCYSIKERLREIFREYPDWRNTVDVAIRKEIDLLYKNDSERAENLLKLGKLGLLSEKRK